jgi:hypothetical protein
MLSDILFAGKEKVRDLQGRHLRFCNYKNGSLVCYVLTRDTEDTCSTTNCKTNIPPERISIADLKRLNVWDQLSEVKREYIENGDLPKDNVSTGKRGRKSRSDYSHIPRSFSCTSCSNVIAISPGVLVKKLGLECKDTDEEQAKISEFKKSLQCSTCSPKKRGRSRNPLFKDIPRKLNCSGCQKEIPVNAKAVFELTKGNVDEIKEYVESYLCRKCNPDWGSWLKGKRGRKKSNG